MLKFWDNDLKVNQIYPMDARNGLQKLSDGCVHMAVTSPPYYNLRDYHLVPLVWGGALDCTHEWGDKHSAHVVRDTIKIGKRRTTNRSYGDDPTRTYSNWQQRHSEGQFCTKCNAWLGSLGNEPDHNLYVEHLVQLCDEIKRVLRDDGIFWLNLGDSYSSQGGNRTYGSSDGHTRRGDAPGNRVSGGELKTKDLMGIPWRVAFALQEAGWWLRSDCIWLKKNSLPESVTDRPSKAHEYVFLLTKSGNPTYWTHRDLAGTRDKPKPDYRWINLEGEEVAVEPEGSKERIPCPFCNGTGSIDAADCTQCDENRTIKRWRRINLWKGHDYFYDFDAVREPYDKPRTVGVAIPINYHIICRVVVCIK